jgi:hypothetical protein
VQLCLQQIGIAATFNTEIAKKGAEISAYETRASSIPWFFSRFRFTTQSFLV